MKNIAIIGAGITGISLANMLKGKVNLSIFEKSRGLPNLIGTKV